MIAVLLALVACGAAHGGKRRPVTWQEIALPTTMDPLRPASPVDVRVQSLIYDQLFYFEDDAWRSHILKDSTVAEDGQLHAVLAPQIRWHDGQRLRPEDICHSIAALRAATDSRVHKRHPSLPTRCEVDEGKTGVRIAFAEHPLPDPRAALTIPLVPGHLEDGHDLATVPVGTGPMRATYDNQGWLFEAFEGGSRPVAIPAMRLVVAQDRDEQVRALIKGSVDGIIGVPPALLPEVREAGMVLRHYDQQTWWYLALNTNREPLSDPSARALLDLSLDRDALREALVTTDPDRDNQPCTLISGPWIKDSPRYNQGVPLPTPATVEATPLEPRIAVPDYLDLPARAILDELMAQWHDLGATGAIVGSEADLSEFDVVVGTWTEGDDISALYHTPTAHRGLANVFSYSNPDVDRLFRELDHAETQMQTNQLSRELHALLADDRTHLFLWELDWWSAWKPGIERQVIAPHDYFSRLDRWTVP